MAAVVATYIFPSIEAAQAASKKINLEIGYQNSDCPWGERVVKIFETCRDKSKAAQICLAYGGTPQ